MPEKLPSQAEVVVIGGGVVGASVAYHLAHLGCQDVVLLERSKIGSGTSWHAAGNMETYRIDPLLGEMIAYAVDLYPKLEKETGQALGWRQTGRVTFATNAERMAQYKHFPALARARGIELHTLSPAEVVEKLPIVNPKGVLGGTWVPSDGRINPTDLAMAFARGAKLKGARVFEDTPVTGLIEKQGRVHAVQTAEGTIRCEKVVVAAGLWSPDIGRRVGVRVPLHAVQHMYILTKPIAGITRDLPLFLSYDDLIYGREDVGGLLMGVFDANAIPVTPQELPEKFSFGLLPSNWEQIEPNMEIVLNRFPVMRDAEIRMLLNGPESFTPDMQMLLGESPGLGGCFVATGMNSNGIALSAGAGRLTAEWILHGRPSLDATRLDIRRFAAAQSGSGYVRDRASEVITHMCRMPGPDVDFERTRMLRCSVLQSELERAGAVFKSLGGFERPVWFGKNFEAELAAAEDGVALSDHSSDSKLWLEGPGAEASLQVLSGAITGLAIGHAVRAPMLNERGGTEALTTVWRMGAQAFLITASPEQGVRPQAWIERHRRSKDTVLVDVTSGWTLLALTGPKADDLLALAERGSEIAYAPVRVSRTIQPETAVILLKSEFALGVYRRLLEAGNPLGLRHMGSIADEMLSIKLGIRRFGTEVSPFLSAVASGLAPMLDHETNTVFIGRDALLKDLASPPAKVIRAFTCPCDGQLSFLNAPVFSGSKVIGHATSGAFIPSLGKAALFALVDSEPKAKKLRILAGGTERDLTAIIHSLPNP